LLAFIKVVNILGEPSRDMIMEYIKAKYGLSIYSNAVRLISLQEIEDTIPEMFPIGGDLIIRMLEAELDIVK